MSTVSSGYYDGCRTVEQQQKLDLILMFERKPKNFGITVTAADFNGKTFDGAPLIRVGISEEVFGSFLANDKISIKGGGGTDYALWNVQTPDGVVVAGPGDFIAVGDHNQLTVLQHPDSDYNVTIVKGRTVECGSDSVLNMVATDRTAKAIVDKLNGTEGS